MSDTDDEKNMKAAAMTYLQTLLDPGSVTAYNAFMVGIAWRDLNPNPKFIKVVDDLIAYIEKLKPGSAQKLSNYLDKLDKI